MNKPKKSAAVREFERAGGVVKILPPAELREARFDQQYSWQGYFGAHKSMHADAAGFKINTSFKKAHK